MVSVKNLYVGGLNYVTTKEELRELFEQAGEVLKADVIMDGDRSKGFGFVEMGTLEEAEKAIEMFNDFEFAGRRLLVNEARPKAPRPAGGYNDRPRSGGYDGSQRSSGGGSRY
jgi:cold-inducible RNA-binding protein